MLGFVPWNLKFNIHIYHQWKKNIAHCQKYFKISQIKSDLYQSLIQFMVSDKIYSPNLSKSMLQSEVIKKYVQKASPFFLEIHFFITTTESRV